MVRLLTNQPAPGGLAANSSTSSPAPGGWTANSSTSTYWFGFWLTNQHLVVWLLTHQPAPGGSAGGDNQWLHIAHFPQFYVICTSKNDLKRYYFFFLKTLSCKCKFILYCLQFLPYRKFLFNFIFMKQREEANFVNYIVQYKHITYLSPLVI